ncbi:hypothetical protein PUV54_12495 [Hyphococcus flavus]|uniref:DUF885 domain-containing protein n=1 Tax=Hyphococcus flavus TaxID=1866326 RepID=A0AAE9ZD51_9PROT|nr:hypothetical protein [Hyphococcus flavus]WDI30772.1 hypothetical protein PUV54_12495 [Hyphococcus flavus]
MIRIAAAAAFCFMIAACGGETVSDPDVSALTAAELEESDMASESYVAAQEDSASYNSIAEEYVKLALAAGEHDPAFVDAYNGPQEWADSAQREQRSIALLEQDAQGLLISVRRANGDAPGVRGAMLEKLIVAALARIQMTNGEVFSFDEETRLLYDVVAPQYDRAEFDAVLEQIEALIPGEGALGDRVEAFRNSLAIPEDKLDAVFNAAIAECRKRTLAHYELPQNERFTTEFVTDKPWSGYNWYQGDFESLIQVNTNFPIIIDRAVDLGCHEGYPGHHTWNVMLERDLLNEKGWIEYSVYPLYSPLSITAEGSANYGIELAFPGNEKIQFERDVLFPLAGLDPDKAATLEELNALRRNLSHARNMVARDYLDGEISREAAIDMLAKYRLESRERAEQGVRFIETYRGYVLNYNLGRDIVEDYIERTAEDAGGRWEAFETLLTTPLSASALEGAD